MCRIIEWLVFHLPSRWYLESEDTNCVSWGFGEYYLAVRYSPLENSTIRLGPWARTWWEG